MLLGAHMSTSGGFHRAVQRARQAGCEATQVFVKSNMRWFGSPPRREDVDLYKRELAQGDIKAVFGHAGYLINIAAPEGANRQNSIKSLVQELEFADVLGLPFLVLHPGAHLGAGEVEGLRSAARTLDEVFDATPKSRVKIALENTAGQGSCLGSKVEHLACIFGLARHSKRLGVCIDTAHLFAAGFDIRSGKEWDAVMKRLDDLVGLKHLLAFHLNDSKTRLGSKVDRHADIGKGEIGLEGFRHIVRDARFQGRPGCIELPKSEDLHEDIANLATLRSLLEPDRKRGRAPTKPKAPIGRRRKL